MAEINIVNDNIFLMSLDSFYRDGMKRVESTELLACAESVAKDLSLPPSTDPVEGYYHETPELTRYFSLMRGLQGEDKARQSEINDKSSFNRLQQVCSSDIYGSSLEDSDTLLPRSRDLLTESLEALEGNWQIEAILRYAKQCFSEKDFSLVGMACRYGAPYVVAALRETVALYANWAVGGIGSLEEPEYRWEVSKELEGLANQFIRTVKSDIGFEIPKAHPDNAKDYFHCNSDPIAGRCIAIGFNDAVSPKQYYHWGIRIVNGEYDVEEFWDEELWTTERYSNDHYRVYFEPEDPSRPLCKRDGCEKRSVKLSAFCQKHHDEMLRMN